MPKLAKCWVRRFRACGDIGASLYGASRPRRQSASTVTICEQAGVATTYRISVAVAGAADTPAQYVAFDSPLQANETKGFTIGMTLGAADVIRVRSASGNVSFTPSEWNSREHQQQSQTR